MLKILSSGLLAGLLIAAPVAQAGPPSVIPSAIPSAKAHKALLLDIAAVGKRLVAVGERGHIVLSDDAGRNWRQVPVPVRSLLTAVYFVDAKKGWAVGHDSVVLATADAGETWKLQHYQEFAPQAAAEDVADTSADPELDEAGLEDESGGSRVVDRTGVPLLDVWFRDASHGLAVGAYGLLLRTDDGGAHWQDVSASVANPEGWHFNAIAGVEGGTVVIAGEKGTLYRSDDAGNSFRATASPYQGSFFGVVADPKGAFYLFGLQGSLFRSTDRGLQWHALATGVTSGLNDACALKDDRTMITGNAGVVLTGNGQMHLEKRADRQAVLSCVAVEDGVVLVGEGGAKLVDFTGKNR